MTFEQYLINQNHTEKTVKSYCYTVDIFLTANPDAQQYRYKDVINYIGEVVAAYGNSQSKTRILSSIKRYYDRKAQ